MKLICAFLRSVTVLIQYVALCGRTFCFDNLSIRCYQLETEFAPQLARNCAESCTQSDIADLCSSQCKLVRANNFWSGANPEYTHQLTFIFDILVMVGDVTDSVERTMLIECCQNESREIWLADNKSCLKKWLKQVK